MPGNSAPSAPGTPTASAITNTSAKLSWTAATDDSGIKNYDVLRDGAKVATVTTTTYTDTSLTIGTAYSYSVQARDTSDVTGPVSGAVKVTTTGGGTTDPGTPTALQDQPRLLHRVGRLRTQLPREEPGHLGLRRADHPHQLRLRQRHRRQVHHR